MVSRSIYGARTKALCCSMGLWIVVFQLTMVPQQSLGVEQAQTCFSSCGKISNITYPFRRKDDPSNCGDSRYEVECVKDVAVLRLSHAEYHVQAINYNNYTIRLMDPNIKDTDCSSIPRYFLYKFNFSDAFKYNYPPPPHHWDVDIYDTAITYDDMPLFEHIIYMRCKNESSYVNKNNTSCLDPHTYVVAGDFNATTWKPGCHVKLIAATSGLFQLQKQYPYLGWGEYIFYPAPNISYSEIHGALVYGFELSWLHILCQSHCGSTLCYFNQTSGQVMCESLFSDRCSIDSPSACGIGRRIGFHVADVLLALSAGMRSLMTLQGPSRSYRMTVGGPSHTSSGAAGWFVDLLFVAARVLFGATLLLVLLIYKWRRRHLSTYENIENFLQDNNLMPIRYSYKQIKKMTKNLKVKLGQGGFGSVYKGKLRSGTHVAIKMLDKSEANGQDFISEVATIGRIHHVNVVRLIGFCAEGSKRALVYDFMSNGSLDKYIFSKEENIPLSYEKIYEISLGVANGISYLHQGCDMQILHFDIKPHNILLDENFIPKVSDFGLAKLYPIDRSIVTLTDKRGTPGYIAPELFYSNIGGISHKADVYSFGMLLMEMANRRKNLNPQAEDLSQLSKIFFPTWVYDQFSKGEDIELDNATEDEKNTIKKMIMVALWCIQLKPCDRPSMKLAVEMLEGELENLAMPPELLLYPNEASVEDQRLNSEHTTSDHSTEAK